MFSKTYLGLDVRSNELRAVALRRKGRQSLLVGGRVLPVKTGLLTPRFRDPNILDRRGFVERLQDLFGGLGHLGDRVAVSLPGSVGRLLMTQVETPFKNKEEGVEILKWQLKDSLPVEASQVHLDYQIIERKENGSLRVLVAMMAKPILEQYEECLLEAGFHPALIDFHPLNLYAYYRNRIDLGDNFVLITLEDTGLSFQYFQHQILSYYRSRGRVGDTSQVFQEISRTMIACLDASPQVRRASIFLHTNWQGSESLIEALKSAVEHDVVLLDPHMERMSEAPLDLPSWQVRGLAAAVAVAERLG